MEVIYLLILVSLLVAIGFLIAFIWSIRSNQFDDIYSPGARIFYDEHQAPAERTLYEEEKK